jgi:uncharacterized protein with PQ loop repeat
MACVCDPLEKDGHRFVQFVGTYFSDCVYSNTDIASFAIGISSIVIWLFCQSPQIYENYKLGKAESLSVVFLLIWLTGDITNLAGCILTNQLPTQKYTAMFFVSIDTVMMSQYSYYRFVKPYMSYDSDDDYGAEEGGVTVSFRNDAPRNDNSQAMGAVQIKTVSPRVAEDQQSPKTNATGRVLAAVVLVPLLAFPSLMMSTPPTSFPHQYAGGARELQGRPHTHIRRSGRVLLALQASQEDGVAPPVSHGWELGGTGLMEPTNLTQGLQYKTQDDPDVGAQICNAAPKISPTLETVGEFLSWVSSALYFLSRIPQVYHNYKRQSVEGLSVIMFFSAVMGNLTYGISIIMRLHDVADLLAKLPFLIGSIGTLCFDATIISQFWIYGDGTGGIEGGKDWLLEGASNDDYAELDNEVETRPVDLDSFQSRTRPKEVPPRETALHAVSAPLPHLGAGVIPGAPCPRNRSDSRPTAMQSFSARASGTLSLFLDQRMPVPYIKTINPTTRPATFTYGRSNSFSAPDSPALPGALAGRRERSRAHSIDSPEMGALSLGRGKGHGGRKK